ncbi:hypothetical protein J2R98_001507 [Alkalibacillus filiformis]|uniref:GNAT family N-acetyltransferase n=1 Tax=Alkalibacillus filiformis TaxID=200990 RepID=A0ABU0DTC3_9BACI|nr:GNAT family N-acetyltransferase [Alkalibacillus filiformis]MDQ0351690.1 hypothetical protein [Alkalibacillus filiformis]
MSISTMQYDDDHKNELVKLLDFCHEDNTLLHILNSPSLKFAYSAYYDHQLIGIALVWTSSIHPHCTYFRILTIPDYGAEDKLLNKLTNQKEVQAPLQTSICESSNHLRRLYEAHHFQEIRRTYLPTLKLSQLDVPEPPTNTQYVLKSLKDLSLDEAKLNQLITVVKNNYERTHQANPVAKLDTDQWKQMILAYDTILDGSYIYFDRDANVVAYSFLHESDEESTYELGWCGVAEGYSRNIIPTLITHQIQYAVNCGVQHLIGEFDTTDDHAMEVFNHFPFSSSPALITYREVD